MKYIYRDKILEGRTHQDRLIIDSDYDNVFYEISGRAMCINVIIKGRHMKIPCSMADAKQFAEEIISVVETWSM